MIKYMTKTVRKIGSFLYIITGCTIDIFLNIFFSGKYQLVYIVEPVEWSIKWDGKYITENLNKSRLLRARISSTHLGLRNKIIHFGSVNTLINNKGIKKVHPSNKIIMTWFHVVDNDKRINYIPFLNNLVYKVHTSCNITKEKLSALGLNRDKIIVIPLGVDLSIFKPLVKEEIRLIKKKLEIPENKIIVGSFQKDGEGWSEGFKPKLIKGPDIFCDVIEKLAKNFAIHVLLTGPARGYVKNRLREKGIPYTHKYLDNYPDIVDYYNTLDLYLITSREEGGPKAILESMACGIPVFSTPIGMAPEIISDGKNSFLIDFKIQEAFNKIQSFLNNFYENKKMIFENEIRAADNHSWKIIANNYYNNLYKPLSKKDEN